MRVFHPYYSQSVAMNR